MKRGFTLVEILLVLALTGFLLVGIFSVYMTIKNLTYASALSAAKKTAVLRAAEAFSRDIRSAYAPRWNSRAFFEATKGKTLQGRFDSVRFISGRAFSNPTVLQSPVFTVVWYVAEDAEGKKTLYRKQSAFVDYEEQPSGFPVAMVHGITSFTVEFSFNNEDWFDEWSYQARKRLPSMVRATIGWEAPNGRLEKYTWEASPQVMVRTM